MARGWESKSVEQQQEEASPGIGPPQTRLSPEEVSRMREVQGLLLSRSRVLQQMEASRNARHRKMLQDALADLDRQLADRAKSMV